MPASIDLSIKPVVCLSEVNTWLWLFARCEPSLGGLSVEETALKKRAGREEQVKRAVETCRRWKVAKASSK